jgi:cephalosporin hydroxylase
MSLLTEIGLKYKTDKAVWHKYTDFYDTILRDKRESFKQVMEIGVFEGSSLMMWHDYCSKAQVMGVDISFDNLKFPLHIMSRVLLAKWSQVDFGSWGLFFENRAQEDMFDLIVDDGSHKHEHQQKTFAYLFKYVKPGGFYILEDLHVIDEKEYGLPYGHKDTTLSVVTQYINKGQFESDFLTAAESDYIKKHGKQHWLMNVRRRSTTFVVEKV